MTYNKTADTRARIVHDLIILDEVVATHTYNRTTATHTLVVAEDFDDELALTWFKNAREYTSLHSQIFTTPERE